MLRGDGSLGCDIAFYMPMLKNAFPWEPSALYQCEVMAVIEAGALLFDLTGKNDSVRLYVDSLSALQALVSDRNVSGLTREAYCYRTPTHPYNSHSWDVKM